MEAILTFKVKNEQKFYESALKVGYNEMEAYKFLYVMQQSDLDIFPKMHDERINILLYGWELCEDYKQKLNPNEWELPEEMETILKLLVPWSMDIWFSKEWDKCKYLLKSALIHCLNRARDLLMRMPDMMQINWDFLLLYNLKPWNVLYLKNLTVTKEKTLENGAQSIETEELPATDEDISYVKLEQLPIIVLRLVKIFDQSSIDMVKTLCMRVIAAWNKIHQTELETSGSRRPYIPPEDKRCLMLICHIYLMAVYESDDVKGYVIDNMIHNIRFYYQGFQNSAPLHAMDNLEYTPARYIALTNMHLRVQKRDFFDFFIWNKYDTTLVNLFGVVSQAYKSYLLGNLLMELNNMNEDDFASNIPLYKRLMNSYVNERERSELFLLNELDKIEAQRYAHNIIQTVQNVTDFKSKICKGNRMSNIGNYENSDDTVTPLTDPKNENINSEIKVDQVEVEVIAEDAEDEEERVRIKESELRLDPIFQNLPNNESILYYVYDVLAKKDYKGWHFAKIVLLVKLIDHEQNMIETWRYHPGLTTDFMLNLEIKLSHHYVDLAKIFKDHPFIEQEFWLTAFYLNPTSELYESVKRLGMRNNRKRTDEHTKLVMSIDNIEAKYGLLSSTIDVKELATMSNTDDPVTDYDPLFSALHSLRVPDSLVKDMLTAIFLPRNRSFAWAVDWVILRNRCKMIMTSSKEKKRFVDLNMAEANERLKYLIIDYEKYKNRPQLDYGTIEEGYENLMTSGEFDKVSDDEEEEEEDEEDDFEDDEDVYESKRRGRGSLTASARKKEEEKIEDDNSQEDDPFLMGKRRTRARTAATLASFLFQTLPRASRRKRNQKPTEVETKIDEEKISVDTDDKSSDSKSPITTSESPIPSPFTAISDQKDTQIANVPIKNIKECLKERPTYINTTQGFPNLIDIWNVEKSDLQAIDENCVSLMESNSALQIAAKLKLLYKEINPLGCDEKEYIDDNEMIIHNADYVIKKERDVNAVKEEQMSEVVEEVQNLEEAPMLQEVEDSDKKVEKGRLIDQMANLEEVVVLMDVDENEENVEKERVMEQPTNIDEAAVFVEEHENIYTVEKLSIMEQTSNAEKDEVIVKAYGEEKNFESEIIIEQTKNIEEDAAFGNVEENENVKNDRSIEQTTNIEEVAKPKQIDDNAKNVENAKITDQTTNIEEVVEFENIDDNKTNVENDMCLEQTTNIEVIAEFEEVDEKKVGNDRVGIPFIVDNVEIAEEVDLQVPEETPFETVTEHETTEIDHIKQLQTSEDDSSESIASDMSTAALKDSGEISEPNTEINSKHYSVALDSELNDQIIQNEDLKAKSQTVIDQEESAEIEPKKANEKQQATAKMNQENENEQNKTCKEKEEALEEEHKAEKEIKVDECTTSSHIEIIKEHEEADNTSENDETAMKQIRDDTNKNKDLISDKTLDELIDHQDEIAIELEKLPAIDNELNTFEENSEEPIESLKELKVNSSEKTHFVNLETTNDKELENFKEADDSKEIQTPKGESLQEETNKSDTELLQHLENVDIELQNVSKDKQNKEIAASPKTLEEETASNLVPVDSVETNNSSPESNDNILETHRTEENLAITEQIELDDKDSLSQLPNNESNIILHYSTSEELNETDTKADEAKLETTECKKAADATTDKEKVEKTDCTKAVKALTDQTEHETTDDKKDSYTPTLFLDDTTSDSIKTTDDKQSSDGETRNLTNLCLTKNVQILLCRLRPQDLINLRQPKVKLQRVSFEKYVAEFRAKRRRVEGKVYLEFEDSSNSNSYGTNTSSSEPYHPTRVKRKVPINRRQSVRQQRISESDNDSNNSDDFKLSTIMANSRKRRLSTPSTSQSSNSQKAAGPKSARKTGPKSTRRTTGPKSSKQNLVVIPRSASGLKLRISNAEQNRQQTGVQSKKIKTVVYDEIIQLSSSSSDACNLNDLTVIEEEVIEIEDHPLFEEEIII